VLHAGNIGRKQGLELIAEYAAEALRRAANLRFVVLGDGSQRRLLEQRVGQLPNVELRRPVPEAALANMLAAADVLFVHERPTLREMSLPSKLTSYFQAGRPVVAAVAPDGITAEEVRRSGGGIVVPSGHVDEVVCCLDQLTSDTRRAEELGAAGRAYARSAYSREAAARRLDAVIARAVDADRRSGLTVG
jgi:glycosyltransferase involved in cell wall biosynthesis